MEGIDILNLILTLLAQLLRFLGFVVLGLGLGWLLLDLLKKIQAWQGQVAVFLGMLGLVIALTLFTSWAALGAFAAGVGVAIFLWGMPKAPKKDEEKK